MHRGDELLALQRYSEAQTAYEETLRLAPVDSAALNGLGVVMDNLDRLDDAAAAFRAALVAEPDFALAACNLGNVLLKTGDIDAAAYWAERAVALEPNNATFHSSLVNIRGGAIEAAQLAMLERLFVEIDAHSLTEKIDLHFALAGAYENAGRYDDAFEQLRSANALKRSTIDYDEQAPLKFLSSLEGLFTASFIDALQGCGNSSTRPIFVFGMPRSGTTLVEQVLAGHPAVHAAGEINVLEVAIGEELMLPGMTLAELRGRIRLVGDRYTSAIDALAGSAEYVTDKLPHNFCFAPLISVALPNARMIHVRRDRLDTCFSCYATHFAGHALSFTYDLAELGRYYRAYERLATIWRGILPADRFIEVDYERLVDDFETEAKRLAAFCGLPWVPEMLAFHQVRRPVRSASNVQVRRPLYDTSVGRWQRFAPHLGPLIEAL